MTAEDRPSRHVSGRQLCLGLAQLAQERYGKLAPTVLTSWNVTCTRDFGTIVFDLVQAKSLAASPEDSIEDFTGVYDFAETFGDALA